MEPMPTPTTPPSPLEPPTDTGRAARIGLWTLGLGLGGFLLWAAFAPLDEGVPSQGIVALDTKRKVVQRLMAAIKPGGHLLIGHSESLNGVNEELQVVAPSIYRKP